MILSHKLHLYAVNLMISPMFKTDEDRRQHLVLSEYEVWIMQDQVLFMWLLSTISKTVLTRLISCKRSHEVWDKVHKHFNAVMKVHVRQLRAELKTSKKLNKSAYEYVLHIKVIADILLAIGDYISEQDQIDDILDGLPEE